MPKEKLYFLSGPKGALPPPFSGNRIPIMWRGKMSGTTPAENGRKEAYFLD
jgi:hypothetical protein